MKKNIITIVLVLLSFTAISAADLRDFNVVLGGAAVVPAGTQLAITITARDTDGSDKGDYAGPVGIAASVGDIIIEETGNTLTGTFASGRWTGFIQVMGSALPLTLTCVDFASGSTGTVFKNVSPNSYTKPLLIMQGMTWAPGTVLGYTGWPVTQTTTAPLFVTVLAVDSWNNTINSGFPTVRLETTSNGKAITPTSVNMSVDAKANTLFAITLYPNPDLSAIYGITARDLGDPLKFDAQNVFFASLNDYFIWAEGPASAVAGQNFTVTVKISHFAPADGVPVPGLSDTVQIAGIDYGGNSLNPGLLPAPAPSGPCVNGVRNFVVSYLESSDNEATGIRISPTYIGSKTMNNAGLASRYSNTITIYAAAPDNFNLEASRLKLKRNENSILSVKIEDQYANPVSNTAVDFTVLTGTGLLKDSLGNTSVIRSINTNLYGYAYITVTAGSNTITTVSAAVAGIAGTQTKTIEFADIIEKEQVRNYPNPFNPSQGPTTIEYYLDDDADVTMTLYSFSGAQVWKKEISAGTLPGGKKGYNPYSWNGITDRNMTIAAGLYTLKIEVKATAGKYTLTRKIAVKK